MAKKSKNFAFLTKTDPTDPELLSALGRALCRSEGFPLAAYLIPGRDGMGAWPNSKIVPDAASVANTTKTPKNSQN